MKFLYLFFVLIILHSCSNNDTFLNSELGDENSAEKSSVTRAGNDSVYYFSLKYSIENFIYDFKGVSISTLPIAVLSYVEHNNTYTVLTPIVIDKPAWISKVACWQVDLKTFLANPIVDENPFSSERTGTIVLRQPGSNKTLSIPLTQGISNNIITINVATIFKNRYQFTATASYPIKGNNLTVDIPFVVYNDGGEMNETARIIFNKGDITSYSIMDYGPCPLVYYHGDLKGYRLSPGIFYSQNDGYNYSFNRYW